MHRRLRVVVTAAVLVLAAAGGADRLLGSADQGHRAPDVVLARASAAVVAAPTVRPARIPLAAALVGALVIATASARRAVQVAAGPVLAQPVLAAAPSRAPPLLPAPSH
jgi:hypothetical protein